MGAPWWRGRRAIKTLFIAAYAVLLAYVMLIFVMSASFSNAARMSSISMVDGTAYRPFVYRLVVPTLTKWIVALTPPFIENIFNDTLLRAKIFWVGSRVDFNSIAQAYLQPQYLYMHVVLALVMTCFLGAYVLMQYRLAKLLLPHHWAGALFAPIVGLMMIPGFIYPKLMIYDPAVLFFATLGYYYMYQQKWTAYLICLFFATLNKETAIFLTFFYALYYWPRLPRKTYMRYLVFQLMIYVYTKAAINLYFMNNPGFTLEDHLSAQISVLLHPRYALSEICLTLMTLFILTSRWSQKPAFAKYILFNVAGMFLAYIFYGNSGEYRVFFDTFPLVTILIADTIIIGTGIAESPIFRYDGGKSESNEAIPPTPSS